MQDEEATSSEGGRGGRSGAGSGERWVALVAASVLRGDGAGSTSAGLPDPRAS